MKNPRISAKERGLLKGALRRVFSRSDLRKQALESSRIEHIDASRPRVTKWSKCSSCQIPTPTYLLEIDHIQPIVPVDKSLESMDWNELVDKIWCEPENLKAVCKECHRSKTKSETKERAMHKRALKAKLNNT